MKALQKLRSMLTFWIKKVKLQSQCHVVKNYFKEKGIDLTQSYDKSPSTNRQFRKKKIDNTKTLPKTSITQRLRTS